MVMPEIVWSSVTPPWIGEEGNHPWEGLDLQARFDHRQRQMQGLAAPVDMLVLTILVTVTQEYLDRSNASPWEALVDAIYRIQTWGEQVVGFDEASIRSPGPDQDVMAGDVMIYEASREWVDGMEISPSQIGAYVPIPNYGPDSATAAVLMATQAALASMEHGEGIGETFERLGRMIREMGFPVGDTPTPVAVRSQRIRQALERAGVANEPWEPTPPEEIADVTDEERAEWARQLEVDAPYESPVENGDGQRFGLSVEDYKEEPLDGRDDLDELLGRIEETLRTGSEG